MRFLRQKLLRSAHGIETWLATDQTDQSRVVLKQVQGLDPGLFLQLTQEARILQELELVEMVLVERHQVVRRYLDGPTLAELPKPLAPIALRPCLSLLDTLQAAHDRGIIHRDLKPPNLVLQGDRFLPIDFGLARHARIRTNLSQEPAGTGYYLAPEVAGFLTHEPGPPSDLYSLGCTLFELLTGSPPYPGQDLGEVLQAHLSRPVPRLRQARPDLSPALEAMLDRLLAKAPQERYQTARAVRADLEEIVSDMEAGRPSTLVVGRRDRRAHLADPPLVGRQGELEELESARGLVHVQAPAGGGKTRLLDELEMRLRRQGRWVLRSGAEALTRDVPLGLFLGLSRDLLRDGPAWLAPSLGAQASVVRQVLPELTPLLGEGPASEPGRAFTVAALSRLLAVLGTRERPAAVLLDDLQWADDLSRQALERFAQEEAPHVLVVAAARPHPGLLAAGESLACPKRGRAHPQARPPGAKRSSP